MKGIDMFGIKRRREENQLKLKMLREAKYEQQRFENIRRDLHSIVETIYDLETGNAQENALYNWGKIKEIERQMSS